MADGDEQLVLEVPAEWQPPPAAGGVLLEVLRSVHRRRQYAAGDEGVTTDK